MNVKLKLLSLIIISAMLYACSEHATEISDTDTDPSEKTEITIGITAPNPDINEIIAGFNKSSEKYAVIVKDYFDSESSINEMQNNLKIDIVSGNPPDIILCADSAFYYTLFSKGAFADVSDCLDTSGILPNILDICTEDDSGIYRIPLGFSVTTGVCKAEYGTESCEIYSYSEMSDILSGLDNGTSLAGDMMSAIYCTKEGILSDFTDFKNFNCNFNSPEFAQALEFYKEIKSMKNNYIDDSAAYVNGKARIFYCTLCNAQTCCEIINSFNNEDIVITPPEHAKISLNQSIAVSHNVSEEIKQGAVDFIKYAAAVNVENPIYFPITENGLKESLKNKDTDIDTEYFFDYISSVNHEAFYDLTVKNIFEEESENYINGAYSSQECGETIQQRVQLYLDEQN